MKAIAQRIIAFGERPFVRSVMVVASGSAAAQAITMIFSPIVTRLYGPEAYGNMGVFMSIAGVASTVAALNYPISIVLPRSDADAICLMRVSICIGVATSVVAALGLYVGGPALTALLNVEGIVPFVHLIPVYMFVAVLGAIAGQWLTRQHAFALVAKASVWQALVTGSMKIGLGVLYPTAAVLVLTNVLGALLGTIFMALGWHSAGTRNERETKAADQASSMGELAVRYRDFPLLRTPQVFLNTLSHSLPIMMLSAFFGASSAGFYSIASAVTALPAGLLGNAVAQVFYPRITEAINRGENARALIIKATTILALSGLAPFGLVVAAGPWLFATVFGTEWRPAGSYAQWLSIWLFFQYINRPAVSAIPALRLQGGLLMYEIFSSSTKVTALILGYGVFGSAVTAVALFSLAGAFAYIWLIFWVLRSAVHCSEPTVESRG